MSKLTWVTILVAALLACAVVVCSAEGSELSDKPKVIVKTVFQSKWVKGEDGKLVERKIPQKKLFQIIMKKTSMRDPLDPSKTITVKVPTEIPYKPNRKTGGRIAKLKARFKALRKREKKLRKKYNRAKSNKVDWQVLEDGAPAPPDPQMQKMAQDLYDELAATQLPKAKNYKEKDIRAARELNGEMGAKRQAWWDFFDDMRQKLLVPKNGWSSTM